MRHFAVVGSGPAGFYTAEALAESLWRSRADRHHRPLSSALWADPLRRRARSPVAEGCRQALRQGRRQRGRRFHRQCRGRARRRGRQSCSTSTTPSSSPPARRTTASSASRARIWPGVIGSAEFVGWYNGHPDFADLDPPLSGTHAAIIGNGNVALDCARILAKTRTEFDGLGHRRPRARRARQTARSRRSRSSAAAGRTRLP